METTTIIQADTINLIADVLQSVKLQKEDKRFITCEFNNNMCIIKNIDGIILDTIHTII